jgi:hypothetical protein
MCPAGGLVGNGVPVVILTDFPVGKILRVIAVVVTFPSFSVAKGLLSWRVHEGQEGGMPPPVLGYAFAVEYAYRYSQT